MDSPTNFFGLRARFDAQVPQRMRITRQVEMFLDAEHCCPEDKFRYRDGQLAEIEIWGLDLNKLKSTARYLFNERGLQVEKNPIRFDSRTMLFSHATR